VAAQTIHIADSDTAFAHEVSRDLSARDYQVVTASDAVQAVECCKRLEPALVVARLMLPGGGGIRVHQHILRTGRPTTPVVYLVDAGAEKFRAAAVELGPAAMLDAPLPAHHVARHVACLIGAAARFQSQSKRDTALRVLVIEDDPAHRDLIRQVLNAPGREPIEVTFAHTVVESREVLAHLHYDCVIVDHHLPDGTGIEVIEHAEPHLLTTPVIALSGGAEHAVMLDYFRGGCADFLLKSDALQGDRLRRRLTEIISRFQRQTMMIMLERRQLGDSILESQESLVALARTDHLTGICNRAVFDDALADRHRICTREKQPFSLCMIDADRFKQFNDVYGHGAGDEALRAIGQTLAGALRDSDLAARFGGEEFAVILDQVSGAAAYATADRLRQRVADKAIPHRENKPHERLTISIGVAVFDPTRPIPAESLLHQADGALYQAKSIGRNCVVMADSRNDTNRTQTPGQPLTSAAHPS
jgi:diguanylate cyclase (GGDEF)-like protein